jgi:hypothetical protein
VRHRHLLPVAALVPLLLTGCGSPRDPAALATARTFLGYSADDPAAACALLAPATRSALADEAGDCVRALADAELGATGARTGPADVVVQGHSARVALDGTALFLSLFDDGWRVSAAGCHRPSCDAARPAECAVKAD